MNRKKTQTPMVRFFRGWFGSLLIALLLATSVKSAIADWNVVPTGSMKPTIMEGDRIFVNKLAYDLKIPYTTIHLAQWGDPKRGDIVVFYSPSDGTRLVKRVVGLPGDVVYMRHNRLHINGCPLTYLPKAAEYRPHENRVRALVMEERLGKRLHPVMLIPDQPSPRSFGPVRIPTNHYFMMGDNRDNSADSRYFGFVHRSRIIGRTSSIVISLNPDHFYAPRWKRFFTHLP